MNHLILVSSKNKNLVSGENEKSLRVASTPGIVKSKKSVFIKWKDGFEERTRHLCKRCELPICYSHEEGLFKTEKILFSFILGGPLFLYEGALESSEKHVNVAGEKVETKLKREIKGKSAAVESAEFYI